LILGAIFVKSKHIQQFCVGFHTYCSNFHRFFPDFCQIKHFGGGLAPPAPPSYTSALGNTYTEDLHAEAIHQTPIFVAEKKQSNCCIKTGLKRLQHKKFDKIPYLLYTPCYRTLPVTNTFAAIGTLHFGAKASTAEDTKFYFENEAVHSKAH